MVEFSINTKQAIAVIWTLVAFGLSLAIVLTMDMGLQWWALTGLFFGLMLVITLPIYLLLALWQITSKSESS